LNANLDRSKTLINALQDPAVYPHPVTQIRVLETHISWVLLTGPYAYKIKKPVNLGFLDFSTLPLRQQACREEVRLNGRLAPTLYLDVVPIAGTPDSPNLDGHAEPFEFAVKMREFPLEDTLDQALDENKVQNRHIDQLAKDLAQFHANLPAAPESSSFGEPEVIQGTVMDVVHQFSQEPVSSAEQDCLESLRAWIEEEYSKHSETFFNRKRQGFIRECHGDLHLANVVLLDDIATPFDGIEFSETLRWIDVMNDTAFPIMDLMARGRSDFAWRFLNGYLEYAGDYEGLSVLRFYELYRALVRAKVAHIRLKQHPQPEGTSSSISDEYNRYLRLAQSLTHRATPKLIIMHGLSGSGKTTISQSLLESIGAIRLRSDIERKRLFGMSPTERSAQEIKGDLYGPGTTDTLHDRLQTTAQTLLRSGYSVIVDATFLKRRYRDLFCQLAREEKVSFGIIDVQSSLTTLEERITSRAAQQSDASEADLAILKQQCQEQESLGEEELNFTFPVNSEELFDPQNIIQGLGGKPN